MSPLWKSHCKRGHALTDDNVIWRTIRNGQPSRVCVECKRIYQRGEKFREARRQSRRKRAANRPPRPPVDRVTRVDLYPNEEWRPAPGFEGRLEVSDQGHVRTVPPYGHVQYPKASRNRQGTGYLHFYVGMGEGVRKTAYIHKMVCAAFHGPKPKGAECIRHLNDDPTDNRAVNLAWGTLVDNAQDRKRNERLRAEREAADRVA